MDKKVLNQISSTRAEIKDLQDKIDEINKKPINKVIDSVKGSSSNYPYIQHNCTIEGIDNRKVMRNKKNRNKYRKQIESKQYKLEKLINKLEYDLNYIEDSEIRRIIRHRYEEDLNWVQIMFKMNYSSEEAARIKLKRFLEKK